MDLSTLHWPGGAPWWLLAALALALAESLRRRVSVIRERLPAGRTAVLIALRGLLYVLVVFFLSGPTLTQRRERALPPKLLILVDSSKSMGVKDEAGGGARLSSAIDFLVGRENVGGEEGTDRPPSESLLDRLAKAYDIRLRRFDSTSHPLARENLPRLQAAGRGSDPVGAVRASLSGRPFPEGGADRPLPLAERPLGILLLTDGGDTSGGPWPPEDAAELPPVIGVGFGSPRDFRDISLQEVRAPKIAFQDKEVRLEVTLSVRGFIGKKLPVALTREGRVIRTLTIDIRDDPTRKTVAFRFTPSEVGSMLLAVETPLQRGELVGSNNRVEIPLDVRRDKIRILTITGAPAWNYRFLRVALKQDPAVDLVSFVFLRSPEDDAGVPTRELSLIPFPLDKIFTEELKNFEILVFDNFSALEYFSNYYLERVTDYVKGGGAFLVFGGRQAFASGGYVRGPLEEMLPVRLNPSEDYRVRLDIPQRLTRVGLQHPITRLSADPEANAALWKSLPSLRRANVTFPLSEGQVLVAGEGEGGSIPLIAARRFGEGRVLTILSDEMWRWNFSMVAAEKTNSLYLRLVAQMLRWLANDPASSQVRILPEAEPGEEGFSVIRIDVRDESYGPAPGAQVLVTLRDPYGNMRRVRAAYQPETGEFEARFRPSGAGSYRVEVSARLGDRPIGRSVRTVSVGGAGGAEMADTAPHWERLSALSKATGGRFLASGALSEKGRKALSDEVINALKGKVPPKLLEVRDVRLWSIPWIGALLILLPALEWTMRRLWGLA